jgi:NADH-quinone oxidoreductase subunit J
VYVGAVMVLFLFVVMMLDINFDKLREGFWKNLPLAGLVGFAMAVEMALVLYQKFDTHRMPAAGTLPPGSNTRALGQVLYTDYVLPFELAAVVLLVAIVAAIALTLRKRKETKFQNARDQVNARVADRLRIVKGLK